MKVRHSYIAQGAIGERKLEDGRVLVVYPMTFGKARLCIGPDDGATYDDAYCYERPSMALIAMAAWDGEGDAPDGWYRHIGSGRRRPDGDAAREYVQP